MADMKDTLYIESSVIGYYTSGFTRDLIVAAHQQITREWWKTSLPRYESYISVVVMEEISRGNPEEAEKRKETVNGLPILALTEEVGELADIYFSRLKLPEKVRPDSYHLALAAGHGMDYLVTWNCAHIANARIKRILEEINVDRGIRTPTICTPEELLEA
jgi:predicted nucleic acid-binding protein